MIISGKNTLDSSVDQVWAAINDPAVLARSIPGCESLEVIGPDRYAMRVTAGVAAIKGTYEGEVAITEKHEPESLKMKVSGAGAPGTIDADVDVGLAPADAGTDLSYEANASVGGTIGGVGQRMLGGVTRKMAGQFFTALDQDIASGGATQVSPGTLDGAAAPKGSSSEPAESGTSAVTASAPTTGQVFPGRSATANANATFSMEGAAGFAAGTVVGGLLVAIGVVIGSRLGRRR